jgi:hypothetical protein
VSLYTNSHGRIVMQHYCALTARGNLATPADAHMHRMVPRIKDATHFSEVWTKRENGKDVVSSLDYTGR